MMQWWKHTPSWQRFVVSGFTMLLFVLVIQTWIWDSLNHAMITLDQDIAELTQKHQASMKNIALLQNVEQEVVALREKLSPRDEQLLRTIEPKAFRKDVVNIGKRTGVVVHLWNPQQPWVNRQPPDSSLDIVVKVEGRFHDTVQFINEVLKLPWVKTVNPMMLARKQDDHGVSMVMTNFTIRGITSKETQESDELLKT